MKYQPLILTFSIDNKISLISSYFISKFPDTCELAATRFKHNSCFDTLDFLNGRFRTTRRRKTHCKIYRYRLDSNTRRRRDSRSKHCAPFDVFSGYSGTCQHVSRLWPVGKLLIYSRTMYEECISHSDIYRALRLPRRRRPLEDTVYVCVMSKR